MYTIDEFLERFNELREIHGGDVPVVIASMPGGDVFEGAACELGFATLHDDCEGGKLFKRNDEANDSPICILF